MEGVAALLCVCCCAVLVCLVVLMQATYNASEGTTVHEFGVLLVLATALSGGSVFYFTVQEAMKMATRAKDYEGWKEL